MEGAESVEVCAQGRGGASQPRRKGEPSEDLETKWELARRSGARALCGREYRYQGLQMCEQAPGRAWEMGCRGRVQINS